MNEQMKRIEDIKNHGMAAKGRKEYISLLEGARLSRGACALAKCYDCMGYYADGKQDCKIPTCPLYIYMPYRETPDPRRVARKTKKQVAKNDI